MFILDRIDRELHSLKCLEFKFGSSFDKIPVRIVLDVLFHVFRFSEVFFKTLPPSWH